MRTRTLVAFLGAVLFGAVHPGCSSNDVAGGGLASVCKLNSDCAPGLVCSSGICHTACASTRDCPSDTLCVKSNGSTFCQLSDRIDCTYDSDCIDKLVCGNDGKCRNECQLDKDCVTPQVCAKGGFCAEPTEVDPSGALPNTLHRDAGSSGGSSGRGSGGAPGTGGGNSSGGASATGGAAESGGAPGTGGNTATGGTPSTGGTVATGGNPGTGGGSGGNPQDAAPDAPPTVTLTVTDYLTWCTYAVEGDAPLSQASKSYVVPKGSVVHLSGTPNSGLMWGYWTGTDGDTTGKDTNTATTVTMDADKQVTICCPPSATIDCPT